MFQDIDCGPLCDAIETVTRGIDGAHFSHVGIVSTVDGTEPLILEAVSAGVVKTPLSTFLDRSHDAQGHPKVLVGRLDEPYAALIPDALDTARRFMGLPYDSVYVMEDSSFYCSELVYEAFRLANEGEPVFAVEPMTFRDPKTGETFGPWVDYYEELGVPIPEGEPGLNPGGISRSPDVRIVHAYGLPEGWRGRIRHED
ncbi:MAG: hypothetical protein KJ060_22365 [Candidatus Hydrogenedentes bacterium]|nr:hypothetical protein [Candidatus Hydrogenedentota bacterium]